MIIFSISLSFQCFVHGKEVIDQKPHRGLAMVACLAFRSEVMRSAFYESPLNTPQKKGCLSRGDEELILVGPNQICAKILKGELPSNKISYEDYEISLFFEKQGENLFIRQDINNKSVNLKGLISFSKLNNNYLMRTSELFGVCKKKQEVAINLL